MESFRATSIVNATGNVLRKTEDSLIIDRTWNIETLVMKYPHFEASDQRDIIFALLSLANDRHLGVQSKDCLQIVAPLAPDYTESPLETYSEFVRHCIASSGSLDIICRHWAVCPARSWIGNVKESAFGPPSRLSGRVNGDSLVGDPDHKIYNASRGRKPVSHFER